MARWAGKQAVLGIEYTEVVRSRFPGDGMMSVVVLDCSAAEKLKAIDACVQLRDEHDSLIGYFRPAVNPGDVDQFECPVSEEELLRRAQHGGGRPVHDILRDLRNRA